MAMHNVWGKICDKHFSAGMCRPQCQEPPQKSLNLDLMGKKLEQIFSRCLTHPKDRT